MKPPPPSPSEAAIAESHRALSGAAATAWRLTGRTELRTGWFRRAVPWVEERRLEFRPLYTGYTPANWREAARWRRARAADLAELLLAPLPRSAIGIVPDQPLPPIRKGG